MGIPRKVPTEPGASSGGAAFFYNTKKGKLRFRHGFGMGEGEGHAMGELFENLMRAVLEFY